MALSVTPLHNWYRMTAITEKLDVAALLSWICFKRPSKKQFVVLLIFFGGLLSKSMILQSPKYLKQEDI
ncbi:MAG: hypothetical protein ACPF9G_13270, partial [Paracoccaceae bacterium]